MSCIDDDHVASPPPSPSTLLAPNPSSSFPFLGLPAEIRDEVYYYALLCPFYQSLPLDVCPIHHSAPASPSSRTYWGTERSTRLFRVSHQVSKEALRVFYSSFKFQFPQYSDLELIISALRDTLTYSCRAYIRAVKFFMIQRTTPGPIDQEGEEQWQQVFRAVVELLPCLREGTAEVELIIGFLGADVPHDEVRKVVDRALRRTSPIRHIKGLRVRGSTHESAQRVQIVKNVREALNCC